MIKPESDWSTENEGIVEGFSIDCSFAMPGADVDIRRFDWVRQSRGPLAPEKHYLDLSLVPGARRSLVKADTWSEPRESGGLLYLPPNFEYWGEPALERRHTLCVAFSDRFLLELFESDRPAAALLPSADVQSPALRRYLHGLAAEMRAPGFATRTLLESMLIGTAVELARHLRGAIEERPVNAGVADRQVRRIADYVMENLSSPLSVAEIARACGMSTRHVARVFKESTGLGLGEFVARSRMALAKELLESDEYRIKEISWRCGFRSTSAFSAAFRAATNMTPRAYRYGPSLTQ